MSLLGCRQRREGARKEGMRVLSYLPLTWYQKIKRTLRPRRPSRQDFERIFRIEGAEDVSMRCWMKLGRRARKVRFKPIIARGGISDIILT